VARRNRKPSKAKKTPSQKRSRKEIRAGQAVIGDMFLQALKGIQDENDEKDRERKP